MIIVWLKLLVESLSGDQEIRSLCFGLILSQQSRPTFLLFCIMTAIFSAGIVCWSWICCNIFNWDFVIPDKRRIFGAIHQVRIGWKPSRQPFRPQGPPFPGKRKEKHFLLFLYFFNSFTLSLFKFYKFYLNKNLPKSQEPKGNAWFPLKNMTLFEPRS